MVKLKLMNQLMHQKNLYLQQEVMRKIVAYITDLFDSNKRNSKDDEDDLKGFIILAERILKERTIRRRKKQIKDMKINTS